MIADQKQNMASIINQNRNAIQPESDFLPNILAHKTATKKRHLRWLYSFMILTFLFQIALVPSVLYPIRTYLRVALFAMSLCMLVLPFGNRKHLPVSTYGAMILFILAIGIINPYSNSIFASFASIALNLAIIGPIFWLGRMNIDADGFRNILLLFWAFNATSCLFGVLEVIQPGRFSRESSISKELIGNSADGLKITLADGTNIYRPMGLTDTPGGASQSGFFTILLGSFFLISTSGTEKKYHTRFILVFALGISFGLFCIYLSQIRSLVILTIICVLALLAMLVKKGETNRAMKIVVAMGMLATIATFWATAIGGSQVWNRLATLIESDAGTVYYKNRGVFLEDTLIRVIPEYPFGAGLGRWGMIYSYFGDRSSQATAPLWAEIQSTAWIYDGGVPLMIIYYLALFSCLTFSYRTAVNRRDAYGDLAIVVFAHNIAILTNTFSYIPFIGQSGLYFWLLNAGLMSGVANSNSAIFTNVFQNTSQRFRNLNPSQLKY